MCNTFLRVPSDSVTRGLPFDRLSQFIRLGLDCGLGGGAAAPGGLRGGDGLRGLVVRPALLLLRLPLPAERARRPVPSRLPEPLHAQVDHAPDPHSRRTHNRLQEGR